jgi:hypothetical protein
MDIPTALRLADASDKPGLIAGLIAMRSGPATPVLSALSGRKITVHILTSRYRAPTDDECVEYQCGSDDEIYYRTGRLMAEDMIAANITLKALPMRVTERAWCRIVKGEPIGVVLGEGMSRAERSIKVYDNGIDAVATSAKLAFNGLFIGTATERIPRSFCDLI